MSKTSFNHVKITGMSVVVPEKEINIYDEAHYYGGSTKKIDRMRKMVGTHKRRVVDDKTTASDLGIEAASTLINDMKIDINKIDALVYVVQQPDFSNPATAFYIHKQLKLSNDTPAFDINMGCAGFVYGMWNASQMIESGTCKKMLLICADTPAKGMNLDNRNSAPLFGDAGVATLVEYSEDIIKSHYNIETHSEGMEAIITPLSGARLLPASWRDDEWQRFVDLRDHKIETAAGNKITIFDSYLDGMAVFNFTINVVPKNIKALMDYAEVQEGDIEALCLHQANKQIVQAVGEGAGFPLEKVPYHAFENYGNNTMCSISTNIATVLKEKTESEHVKIVASGFGNGLTCASCVLELNNIYNSGIKTYISPDDKPSRDDIIDYWLEKIKGH